MACKHLKHCLTCLLASCLYYYALQPGWGSLAREVAACSFRTASEWGELPTLAVPPGVREPWECAQVAIEKFSAWAPPPTAKSGLADSQQENEKSEEKVPTCLLGGKLWRSHLPTVFT